MRQLDGVAEFVENVPAWMKTDPMGLPSSSSKAPRATIWCLPGYSAIPELSAGPWKSESRGC